MLTQLRIQNFKSWRDTGVIRFAPLTGFFGANSSGKTSILQLLLLLKQTVESTDRSRSLELGSNLREPYVNLGTFTDIVFQKLHPGFISFGFDWEIQATRDLLDEGLVGPHKNLEDDEDVSDFFYNLYFEAEIQDNADLNPILSRFLYRVTDQTTGNQNESSFEFSNAAEAQERVATQSYPVKFYNVYSAQKITYPSALAAVSTWAVYVEQLFYGLLYLGPLREHPQRHYLWGGGYVAGVGNRGELAIPALLADNAKNPYQLTLFDFSDSLSPYQTLSTQEYVAQWLKRLDLIHSFSLQPIVEGRKEYEVRVKQSPHSPEVLLTEVGFGVSQILPVLTLCYYAAPGSILILEQPEIHLHPAVQSGLADVFIDVIKNRNVQIILESHSEHLLHRLQRRIAEEKLLPEDVALYFTRIEDGESKLEELRIDEYGNISNWPSNFFGDVMGDLVAMTRAAMRRQGANGMYAEEKSA